MGVQVLYVVSTDTIGSGGRYLITSGEDESLVPHLASLTQPHGAGRGWLRCLVTDWQRQKSSLSTQHFLRVGVRPQVFGGILW